MRAIWDTTTQHTISVQYRCTNRSMWFGTQLMSYSFSLYRTSRDALIMAWSLRVKNNFASVYVWKYINLSDWLVLKWFSDWDIFCSEVFRSNVRYSYNMFAHRHEGKPIISKSCTFVSLCQRHVACLVDISATINPLCIFGTTFTWGGYSSSANSFYQLHQKPVEFPLYRRPAPLSVWLMHAHNTCMPRIPPNSRYERCTCAPALFYPGCCFVSF